MFIFSEDHKSIVNPSAIIVQNNTFGLYNAKKGMKYILVAMTEGQHQTDMGIALGAYPTEEKAMFELERIMSAMEAGDATYRIGQF